MLRNGSADMFEDRRGTQSYTLHLQRPNCILLLQKCWQLQACQMGKHSSRLLVARGPWHSPAALLRLLPVWSLLV